MSPIQITSLGGLPDQARPQTSDGRPPQSFTGRVYALKDGSGYAALASDGSYYRVDAGSGHGLMFSRAGGFVDAAMVDVVHGPVKSLAPRSIGTVHAQDASPKHGAGDEGVEVHLLGGGARGEEATVPALEDAGHAATSSRETRALMVQKPGAALDSQANLAPQNVLSLLD